MSRQKVMGQPTRDAYGDALAGRGRLLIHAGAQTTADTVTLATHAREIGADGVAVIPPPYFRLDDASLTAHFLAAAAACAPLPFFIYVFTRRSGYPLPPDVIRAVAERAPNLVGLKVSESPLADVLPYLGLGLPVLVGSEPLIVPALAAGAVGTVSGLAAAFPDVVRAVLDAPDAAGEARLEAVLRKHGVDYGVEWLPGGGKPFVTGRGRLVEVVSQAIRSHTGRTPELSTTGGTSDARFIAEICPEVVEFGPVNASIHKLNEHIELAALEKLPRIYLDILRALLP